MHINDRRVAYSNDRALVLKEADKSADLAEIGRLAELALAVAGAPAAMPAEALHNAVVDDLDRDAVVAQSSQEMARRAAGESQQLDGARGHALRQKLTDQAGVEIKR
jgi:hypothetical protein